MKSKSRTFFNLVTEVDNILGKMHANDSNGQPINPGSDHWNETRDKNELIKAGAFTLANDFNEVLRVIESL